MSLLLIIYLAVAVPVAYAVAWSNYNDESYRKPSEVPTTFGWSLFVGGLCGLCWVFLAIGVGVWTLCDAVTWQKVSDFVFPKRGRR